eukprot:CAMPEP_0172661224 /NCGR_PEP_ID=MMETSP1074-20121228/4555_1 /TAXON_ID=2916 /ORGANISM="Ceratium fusus, Strain PA161109" /LENGTH=349 /DNA_ID=CAMNT_0013476959 /DNA_START=54 /DNA_END=1103 /DNA_ORIENTATION=-
MAPPSQKLVVNVIQAEGLQHMNHFTGDHPFVVCEVKHVDPNLPATKAETKPVNEGDTTCPVWNEALELDSWQPGEALQFTIYDKGLLGSKTEGKAMLPSEFFYPNGFRGMISVVGLPDARLRLEVPSMMEGQLSGMPASTSITYQAPPVVYAASTPGFSSQIGATYAAPTQSVYSSQQVMMPETVQVAAPQKLSVSILQAQGLQHMNHFTGDQPYVVCEVKHVDAQAEATRVETKPATEGDTLNPFWGETHQLGPWHEGESLEFTIYDKGLIGAKTEGKVLLTPDLFYPNGFSGMVNISGLPHAQLHIIIRVLGPVAVENETVVTDGATKSKKKKKKEVKVGKKSKGCC